MIRTTITIQCDRCGRALDIVNAADRESRHDGPFVEVPGAQEGTTVLTPMSRHGSSVPVVEALGWSDLCAKCTERTNTLVVLLTLQKDSDGTAPEGEE